MQLQSNPINFNGLYIIRGNKKNAIPLYNLIKQENKLAGIPTDCVQLSNGEVFVLTEDDTEKKDSIKTPQEAHKIAYTYVNTNHLYDDNTKNINENITSFKPITGEYERIYPMDYEGMKFYPYKQDAHLYYEPEMKCKCEFNKEIPLGDAIKKIYETDCKAFIHDNSKSHFILRANESSEERILKTIQSNQKLKDLKTKKLVGAGSFNMLFDIGDEKILKISDHPCAPKKTESFDLPIIDKGKDEEQKIYWCITPKGQNETESRIKIYEIKDVLDQISSAGYKTAIDIGYDYPHQFVRWNNKVCLADYDCAELASGKSRMEE